MRSRPFFSPSPTGPGLCRPVDSTCVPPDPRLAKKPEPPNQTKKAAPKDRSALLTFTRIEPTELAADTCRLAKRTNHLLAGFVIPAQPILALKPPSARLGHEIKHDGYRIIARRNGPIVRLYSRKRMTGRRDCQPLRLLPELIKAKSFTIDD
jgi:hypothetical protein